jgi:hypothetical protein
MVPITQTTGASFSQHLKTVPMHFLSMEVLKIFQNGNSSSNSLPNTGCPPFTRFVPLWKPVG